MNWRISCNFETQVYRMKKNILFVFIIVLAFSATATSSSSLENTLFDTYKKGFIERLWMMYPEWATSIGYNKYAGVLNIPDSVQRAKELTFNKSELKKLSVFKPEQLSDLNKIDYQLIKNALEENIWQLTVLKSHEWNPANYNIGETFATFFTENKMPLRTTIDLFYGKLKNVPAYFEAAKKNLKHPSVEHLQLAIEQNEGSLSIFENDYADSVKALHLYPESQAAYLKRGKEAVAAIKSYIQFLKDYKNETPRSFRLGKDLYADKFRFQIQSQYSVDEIYQAAIERKDYLHKEMYQIALKLWPKYFGADVEIPKNPLAIIKKVIDTISVQHVRPEHFKAEIEKQLPELTAFVKEKNLLYMDPTKPLKVRNEPGYMAGVAGASMSSPGPYDKKGTAFYNVGTLDGWSAEKAESYLREYNKYVLQILNIHEAIPGHYVQLVYSNKSPSIIKSILGNGAMVEGWAVYSELMMLENGYGNNEDEMWLLYYKWNLRSVCNTILDISVHTKGMSEQDAMDLLVRQAFQQKTEAEGKWHRVQVTNVQLCSYFTGFKEITDLREAYKKQKGDAYQLKEFNERFLSYGSAPVKYIRELMLLKK